MTRPVPVGMREQAKMSKRNTREIFAKVVCIHAQSVIAATLCLTGLSCAFLLSAFLPGLWSLAGLTTVLLVAARPLLGSWPRDRLELHSMELGRRGSDQSVADTLNDSGRPITGARGISARSAPALGAILDCG